MKVRLGTSWIRHVALATFAVALAASPTLVATSAHAMAAPGGASPCLSTAAGSVPAARRIADTPAVSAAVLRDVEREVAAARRSLTGSDRTSARAAATLPVYRVRVQIHIIHGSHKREHRVKRDGARRLFGILQAGYDGAQSSMSDPMGIVFDLKRITVTKNDRWYHARPMSRADKQMKRRLFRGDAQTLNIYINAPKFPNGGILLGYSRFPWQRVGHRKLDGVTINVAGMPGGTATGYNLGDTVVHETGHWLGLLHTFQDGCSYPNDQVSDTPAESSPNFSCAPPYDASSTVCDPTDLLTMQDPAFNFLDYSFDGCMRMFTAGQHMRVAGIYQRFRLGR